MRKFTIIGFVLLLISSMAYVLADTFLIGQKYATVSSNISTTTAANTSATTANTSANTITEKTYTQDSTTIYVADIVLGEGQTIHSALADDTYGKNITETSSAMAASVGATLAVNGDYYGARTTGYVIRNGELLRSIKTSDIQQDLVLWKDGTMSVAAEGDYTAQQLLDEGALQVLSFGPGLVIDDTVSVTADNEVGQAMTSNPRTAIGYIGPSHYILVVADGRTTASAGLSLLELANFMKSLGATQAYNLDGGGSSTMYYNGSVINNPTTNGSKIEERKVSDILYVV